MVIGRAVLVRMEDAAELETLEGQWWCYCKGIFWVLTLMTGSILKSCTDNVLTAYLRRNLKTS